MVEKATTVKKKRLTLLWVSLFLIAPFVLWFLPGDFFDDSSAIVCPSRLFFNIECFGCGMTRAVTHFHHWQFEDAIYFNQGVLLVYPALVILWGVQLYKWGKQLGWFPLKKQQTVI